MKKITVESNGKYQKMSLTQIAKLYIGGNKAAFVEEVKHISYCRFGGTMLASLDGFPGVQNLIIPAEFEIRRVLFRK